MTRRRMMLAAACLAALLLAGLAILAPTHLEAGIGRAPGTDAGVGPQPPRPPAASRQNEDLIAFLRSPLGAVLGGVGVLVLGAGAGAFFLPLVRPPRTTARRRRSRGKRDRRSQLEEPAPTGEPPRANAPLIAAALAVGCLLLPLVFSIFFDDVFALPKTAFLWMLAGLVGILMVHATLRGARPVGSSVVDLAATGFVFLTLAATILSTDPGHSLIGERFQYQGFLTMTAYVVLFFAGRYAMTQARHVRVLSLALVASGLAVSAYGLVQWLGLDPIWSELWKGRIFSTMGQANMLAAFLGISVVMVIPLAASSRRILRLALVIALGIGTLTLALTFGRGGYLALVAGLIVAGAVALRGLSTARLRRYVARVALGLAVVGLALAALAVAWPPIGGTVARVADRVAMIADPSESSNRIRLDLWTVAVAMTAEHPILGTGPDSYVLEFPAYRDDVLATDRAQDLSRFRVESPHSVYLAIASGMGIPAFAAFLVLVAGCLWLGTRAALSGPGMSDRFALAGLTGGTVVVLVANGFMTGETATSAIGFILMGALVGVSSRLRTAAGTPD